MTDADTGGARSAVRVRELNKSFDGRIILENVDLDIAEGEFVALLGASGSGKSTLLRILAGLEVADSADATVPGNRSVVFQDARLLPFRKVAGNILIGLDRKRYGDDEVETVLAEVGLPGFGRRWPKTLSGGEAQRTALARAILREPHLLLLDEPFASLDALTRIRMHDLVLRLWRRHTPAVLLITHDVDEAILLADRILVLKDRNLTHEVTITVPRDVRSAWPEFRSVRSSLLAELGVESLEDTAAGESRDLVDASVH